MNRVVLVGVVGDARSEEARAQLASVPGLRHDFYPCAASLAQVVELPLLRDEEDRGHFGLEAIRGFVRDQCALATVD